MAPVSPSGECPGQAPTPRPRFAAGAVAFALALALTAWTAPAAAHGQKPGAGQGRIQPTLAALPEALAGVRVQVHETLAPQVVIENPGERVLEVLDAGGSPFLRIGPSGVEGNLASVAFYRTASPSDAVPIPQDVLEAHAEGRSLPPRWHRVSAGSAWGWFDRRIEVDEMEAPHAVVEAGRRAEIGRWEIPLRFVDEEVAPLRGAFVYQPAARGALRLRLTGDREVAPGVRVSILAGRGASFFLRSDSPEPVVLIGREGEPFLRFTPEGVEANRRSPSFADSASLRGGADLVLAGGDAEEPAWLKVASAPRYAWIDTRPLVDVPESVQARGEAVQISTWALPVRIGSGADARNANIEGATWWEPVRTTDPNQESP